MDKINKSKDLKTKLETVIEKTNKQKKVLKKILTQLSKQNGDLDDQSSISENK